MELSLPDQISDPDLSSVIEMAEEWLEHLVLDGGDGGYDYAQYIAEEVLISLYGRNIFDLARKLQEQQIGPPIEPTD